MVAKSIRIALVAALVATAPGIASAQQQSEGYKFLDAVKNEKGNDVEEALNKPGTTVINTRSVSNGETALHIVIQNGSGTYLTYLLSRGANPNVRDNAGTAPIVLAASRGRNDLIEKLIAGRANVNYGNSNGETALIVAVRRRDLAMIHTLLTAGADPDQADLLSGQSAREYAKLDVRSPAVAKELADAPKTKRAAVAGPKF
ncbi:ankyrin repeat domain-containing protein [Sphingomonas sp. GB1N7]|uniref:ankyrin repeat domain-containing protein n=1 Tax=Parasphingomonas caseinilytica TaxID=3096158 RepID=UPI002FC93BBB